MPSVSRAQQKAMFAAKAGKSTLGIPQSVGADFVAADKARAARGKQPFAAGGSVNPQAPSTRDYAKGGAVYRPMGAAPNPLQAQRQALSSIRAAQSLGRAQAQGIAGYQEGGSVKRPAWLGKGD